MALSRARVLKNLEDVYIRFEFEFGCLTDILVAQMIDRWKQLLTRAI